MTAPRLGGRIRPRFYITSFAVTASGGALGAGRGLPDEIHRFFRVRGGRSLLVKGPSGGGKTLFVLQLAHELRDAFVPHHIHPRAAVSTTRHQFPAFASDLQVQKPLVVHAESPWTTQCPSCGLSVDVKARARPIEIACPNCGAGLRLADRAELHRLIGHVQEAGGHSPIPLDLPEIETAYEIVDANFRDHPSRRTLVSIDPIDALEDEYDIPAWRLMKALQRDLVDNSAVHLVAVRGSSGDRRLEAIADGVVRIAAPRDGHPSLRTLSIDKLRGVELRRWQVSLLVREGRLWEATRALGAELDRR